MASAGWEECSREELQDLRAEVERFRRDEAETNRFLEIFDKLDYDVFSNQDWDRLVKSHSEDIVVYWPDGHQTRGIERHIADLQAMFVYAPDTKIKVHPVRFGHGGFTCVTGVMTGTFTKPMTLSDGVVVQPTGKSFTLPMCTVGHWENDVMVEEWLFWDNATYMRELGIEE